MVRIKIQAEQLKQTLETVKQFVHYGLPDRMNGICKNISEQIKNDIRNGVEGDRSMEPITKNTAEMPIRFTTDRRIRGGIRPPLFATGAALSSISSRRTDRNKWQIEPMTAHGRVVFDANSETTAFYMPGAGRNNKSKKQAKTTVVRPARDPIQISDRHIDYIEKEIVDELGKYLSDVFV